MILSFYFNNYKLFLKISMWQFKANWTDTKIQDVIFVFITQMTNVSLKEKTNALITQQ